ncbi:MAG: DegT/DnrJ/EryC1/StrS family aminotransferase [Chloroflexi bacterium]|nr:DegT/DnrJ/EryC1/StrS family aminotransferase [Chloroflexota bacterium]
MIYVTKSVLDERFLLKKKASPDTFPLVPMSAPDLTDIEREVVQAVLSTPLLSMGPETTAFEEAIRNFTGSRHAIAVSSGTAGLHLCVRAADIEDGDLVITTPFSFVASSNVLLFERAVPIFVDVDPLTGNIAPLQVHQAARDLAEGNSASKKWLPRKGVSEGAPLKALLPVDVFGQPADMDPIRATARQFDLTIIEDSCEALGAEYKNRPAGTLGDYGVFAFYPNKQITTGEGAIIVTDDDDDDAMMRALLNQGRSPGDTWLQHTYLGYNYRIDEMSAALGRAQMSRLDELLTKREQVAGWYQERLDEIAGVETPAIVPSTTRMSWFVYVIRIAPEINRNRVAVALKERGIPNRPYFIPIHLQPYMVERFGYQEGDFPITEDLGRRGLAIPFSGVMTEEQVEIVSEAIGEVIAAI